MTNIAGRGQRVQTPEERAAQDEKNEKRKASRRERARRALAECGSNRLALTPFEFGVLLGKSETWPYRQLYSGKVKAISDAGRLLIPRSEVDAFLGRAAEYNPKLKAKAAKEEGARQ